MKGLKHILAYSEPLREVFFCTTKILIGTICGYIILSRIINYKSVSINIIINMNHEI